MRALICVVLFFLGLWFISKGWGIIGILLILGAAKVASDDKRGDIEQAIASFIFMLILVGLGIGLYNCTFG